MEFVIILIPLFAACLLFVIMLIFDTRISYKNKCKDYHMLIKQYKQTSDPKIYKKIIEIERALGMATTAKGNYKSYLSEAGKK